MESQTPELPPHYIPANLLGAATHYQKAAHQYAEAYAKAAIAAAVLKERADAERYRWLRQYPVRIRPWGYNHKITEALDAAIDAAIRARADVGEGV